MDQAEYKVRASAQVVRLCEPALVATSPASDVWTTCPECGTFYGLKPVFREEPAGRSEFDLVAHLYRQRDFSTRTFGPWGRTGGILDHIRKELLEIEQAPHDLEEWMDVVILALDGAWRSGYTPEQVAEALERKQDKNESRQWPDWRSAGSDTAIEHKR